VVRHSHKGRHREVAHTHPPKVRCHPEVERNHPVGEDNHPAGAEHIHLAVAARSHLARPVGEDNYPAVAARNRPGEAEHIHLAVAVCNHPGVAFPRQAEGHTLPVVAVDTQEALARVEVPPEVGWAA
jgi:hypothetical protein